MFLVQFCTFSIFFRTPVGGCIWSLKIFWEASYFRHLKKTLGTYLKLQKLHCKNVRWKCIKNKSWKSYLGNKQQNATFHFVGKRSLAIGTFRARSNILDRAFLQKNSIVDVWMSFECANVNPPCSQLKYYFMRVWICHYHYEMK